MDFLHKGPVHNIHSSLGKLLNISLSLFSHKFFGEKKYLPHMFVAWINFGSVYKGLNKQKSA
jgi:hypothetical protein